ncbi:hypothetical protein [Paracoccus haematequi]|uniref:hypothetical protein n=1 Tax=Paracoccus haematequi TaxID=2491866 RepID=UPI0013DE910F|nr:hypothetical protein [Paracoccus haematequi]
MDDRDLAYDPAKQLKNGRPRYPKPSAWGSPMIAIALAVIAAFLASTSLLAFLN